VEEVAVDIVVTPEPSPVGGEAYPVSKASLLAPWIAGAVLLAGGTGWYVLKRRRAQS
jgi:LPXTG-motif cell wall-anchored protein